MIDFSIIFVITLLVAGVVNLFYEFKRDLMMYQQNSYRNERYMRWLSTSGDTTSLVRLLTYIAIMVMLVPQLSYMFCCCVALIPLCINVGKLIVARYKKPLVWTNRVKRIFAVASLLSVGICVAAWFYMEELVCSRCGSPGYIRDVACNHYAVGNIAQAC